MKTNMHRVPLCLAVLLAWVMLAVGSASALAEKAAGGKKVDGKAAAKKADLKKAMKAPRGKKSGTGKPARKKKKSGAGLMSKLGGPKLKGATGPIKVTKPIWNQKSGFGIPVPPGWSGKTDGPKIVLASPDKPADQTVITLGPEPTYLEASEYLGELGSRLTKKKLLVLPRPHEDILDMRIYILGYVDTTSRPPVMGAYLAIDRPGDQVFVIQVAARDQSILSDTSVIASLGMLRFRNEPLPDFGSMIGLGKTKKKIRLELDKLTVKSGSGTLAEFRIPKPIKKLARSMKFKGEMHRYRIGLATPKGYNPGKSWPVLMIDAPATEEEIARHQQLADGARLVVLTITSTDENTIWPAPVRARIYHCLLNRLQLDMILDLSRVYLMGSGQAGVRAQAVAVAMPRADGVITIDTKTDAITAAIAKAGEAKNRLAAAAISSPATKVKQAEVDALVAGWTKAGVSAAKSIKGESQAEAVRAAVDWLLAGSKKALEADIDKLLARADKLAEERSGQALTIYRRIAGSGLKGPKVNRAVIAADKLGKECRQLTKVATSQPTGGKSSEAIAQFEVAQRFQGSLEGIELLKTLRLKLESQ